VSAALAALGTTPDQVAERLHAGRFFGEPAEAHDCPIARYLRAVLTSMAGVSVGESTVAIARTAGRLTTVYLPDPVRRFIAAFDLGGYRLLLPADYTDPTAEPTANPGED
jgi:hypothetical protein